MLELTNQGRADNHWSNQQNFDFNFSGDKK